MAQAGATELNQKYDLERGRIILTGVQALVRLPLERARLDRALGLKTAGFISGYRGSPLGGYDVQLAAARARLEACDVVVRPAINEDLGATAVWGTQQVGLYPGARFQGVFGIWYGKAPGVDRTGDVFKHANFAGVAPHGGVLAVAGDDHGAKSSSLAAQSEYAFVDAEMPVLAPATIEEVLTFGVRAFDLSRYAGLWTAMTTVAEIMDSSATVDIDPSKYAVRIPADSPFPPNGVHIRVPDDPLSQELRHRTFRLPAAQAFVRQNGFDRLIVGAPGARLGILAAGKAYAHLRQALVDLGIDEVAAARLGLRIYKPGLIWPLEPVGARAFADGLAEVLVIEERRGLVEDQLRQVCYDLPNGRRPRIVGKRDEEGRPLVRDVGELTSEQIARVILGRIPEDQHTPKMRAYAVQRPRPSAPAPSLHDRIPFFCSGCPHNTSTRLPEGSRATAGIGCHYLVQLMPRNTSTFTQMGGEGVSWVGQAPFTDEAHIFANLGDGTYFHSGILAIRQAVAAGVNITYKILFNDAVAMTGGQRVDGVLTVPLLAAQVKAEGVGEVVVVSADPERTRTQGALPDGVQLRERDALEEVQSRLRRIPGVTVLIYDQTCATELRRRRKRGLEPDPGLRLLINERVCEGCGDCSVQSNCVSIEPVETLYGRKRRIDQSSCNRDTSCLKGFCPSFVTVRGGRPPASAPSARLDRLLKDLAAPDLPRLEAQPTNVVLAGVGGQGVTSLAAILGMAAHLDGGAAKSIDMLGMAQKGGGVFVHLRLASEPEAIPEPRVGRGQADLVLANDLVVAHGPAVVPLMDAARTAVRLNRDLTPTAEFTTRNEVVYDAPGMAARISEAAAAVETLAAGRAASELLGDSIFSNMILLGHAWQSGVLPLSLSAIERAIEINGAAVAKNRQAFALGRLAASEPSAFATLLTPPESVPVRFEDVVATLAGDLTSYRSRAYADRFETAIGALAAAERAARAGATDVSLAAARSLHKLMAYKDEYEVGRLYSRPEFLAQLKAVAGRGGKVSLNLAPPILATRDPSTGLPKKREFGGWLLAAMPLLASMKWLRETPLDPFGWTAERRTERRLRDEFFGVVEDLRTAVGQAGADDLLALASLPQAVKGFGHVKAAATAQYRSELERRREQLRGPASVKPRSRRDAKDREVELVR